MKHNSAIQKKSAVKQARRSQRFQKQLPLTKKQKSDLFNEFKNKLQNSMMEYAAFSAWLSHQPEKHWQAYTAFIKNKFLQNLMKQQDRRDKAATNAQNKLLIEFHMKNVRELKPLQ